MIFSTPARLPESLEDHSIIAEMPLGATGYTVPWAMDSYGINGCFLRGSYGVLDRPGGTVVMRITREPDGFLVEVPQGYRYRESSGLPPRNAVPVTVITVAS